MSVKSLLGTLAVIAIVVGCSGPPGTSVGASSGGQASTGASAGGAVGSPAASVPDPCTILSGADATAIFANAGSTGTYADGHGVGSNPANPTCRWDEAGGGIGFSLALCTTATCDYNAVHSFMGGDTASGVGDSAFFASTCSGPDLLGHDQLWATAKGLVFQLNVDCHVASALALDKGDQVMTDLTKKAITKVA